MTDPNVVVEEAPVVEAAEIQPVVETQVQEAQVVEEVDPFTASLTERFGMSEDQLRAALSERESL